MSDAIDLVELVERAIREAGDMPRDELAGYVGTSVAQAIMSAALAAIDDDAASTDAPGAADAPARQAAPPAPGARRWWVGSDGERFDLDVDTREDAVAEAEERGGAWIVHAKSPDLRLAHSFDAARFLEDAEDAAQDDWGDPEGDGTIFDVPEAAAVELHRAVRAAIDAWQDRAGLRFTPWRFDAMGKPVWIPGAPEGGEPCA